MVKYSYRTGTVRPGTGYIRPTIMIIVPRGHIKVSIWPLGTILWPPGCWLCQEAILTLVWPLLLVVHVWRGMAQTQFVQ